MSILKVENIRKSFGKTEVLKGIGFSLEKGDVLAIIGSSGSGKTTLLRCLNFLTAPDEGRIIVNGKVLIDGADKHTLSEKQIRRNLRMNGFMLQRDDVIESIEGEFDEDNKGMVVPIQRVKADPDKGQEEGAKGSADLHLMKQEDFDALLTAVSDKVQQMAEDLTTGHMEIAPKRTDHERSSCTFCDYRGICKFDPVFPECRYTLVEKEKKAAAEEADN